MSELAAKSPCFGLLPITLGTCELSEIDPGHMTLIAPYRRQVSPLSDTLKAAHGMAFPAPNRATGKQGERAVWFGKEQAMLIGPEPDAALADHAALTDQSDAWAVVRLTGEDIDQVLTRLVPVDLRNHVFKRGHTARSLLGHMTASITRTGPLDFEIMVFRSMARTLVHDVETAMAGVAARG